MFSQQLQATWGEDGEQNEKKGVEVFIDVKLLLVHGVSYLILCKGKDCDAVRIPPPYTASNFCADLDGFKTSFRPDLV